MRHGQTGGRRAGTGYLSLEDVSAGCQKGQSGWSHRMVGSCCKSHRDCCYLHCSVLNLHCSVMNLRCSVWSQQLAPVGAFLVLRSLCAESR